MSADLGPDPVRGPMHRDMGDYRAVLRRAMEIPGLSMAVMYSGPLGLAVSWLLLRVYRRAVLQSMAAAATPASATWQPSPVELIRPPTPMRGEGAAPPTFDAIRRRWRRTTLSYGFGGMVFMAVEYAAAWLAHEGAGGFVLGRWLASAGWMLVVSTAVVSAVTWRSVAMASAVLVSLIGGCVAVECGVFNRCSAADVVLQGMIESLVPLVLLVPFLYWRVRAVGPLVYVPVLVGLSGGAAGFFVLLRAATTLDCASGTVQCLVLAQLNELAGAWGLVLAFGLPGTVMALMVAWPAWVALGRRYRQGRFSSLSVTLDGFWISIAAMHAVVLVPVGGVIAAAPLLAFLAYKASVLLLRPQPTRSRAVSLLLLRVFDAGERTDRLFRALGKRWPAIGPLRMIAGPDLATSAVQPGEFLEFLGGRLSREFIRDEKDLAERLASPERSQPDLDRRYRGESFYCHADTWQLTAARLIDEAGAILVDLRGLSQAHFGVRWEIDALLRQGAAGRAVLLVNRQTDLRLLPGELVQAVPTAHLWHMERLTAQTLSDLVSRLLGRTEARSECAR